MHLLDQMLLGSSLPEQILKDYNGQTYWFSANLHSFFKKSKIPKWFNIAVGYGAEGMITGNDDISEPNFLPENRKNTTILPKFGCRFDKN